MKVIKRDQSKQKYDFAKIHTVVTKAFNSVDQEVPEKFLEQLESSVLGLFKKKEEIDVEEIQDCIQKELIKRNKYDVVESFILYLLSVISMM